MFAELKRSQIPGYQHRFFADPTNNRNRKIKRNSVDKYVEQRKKIMSIIVPIKSNFFKATFNPSKFIWVVYHKTINAEKKKRFKELYSRLQEAFKHLNYTEQNLPLCSSVADLQKFAQKYQLKVAIDQSIQTTIQQYDKIVENKNVISVCIIGEIKFDFAKRIRNSVYSSKVHMVEERYENIIAQIARDTESTHIYLKADPSRNVQNLKNFIFPNFMFLNTEYKAETLAYHNNLLCLINLHKDKVDLQLLRDKFISECRQNELDAASQLLMIEYECVPMSHKDRLNLYTRQSFFYRYLNNTLRMARSTDQFYLIGEPFNGLFHAIKHYYHAQKLGKMPRKNFKLYRGTKILEEEYNLISNSIGQFIQIQGFVSTSRDESEAVKFANKITVGRKVILQFIIEDVITKNEDILAHDYGFADLDLISNFQQQEVLINALNVFQVVSINKKGELDYIVLKYGAILNLLGLPDADVEKLSENERVGYYTYKEQMEDRPIYCDIGQINKDTDTHRCLSYYQAKLRQYKLTDEPDEEKIINLEHKLADAYYNNHEPHKAVEFLEKVKLAKRNITKTQNGRNTFTNKRLKRNQSLAQINDEIELRRKLGSARVQIDDFGAAEEELQVIKQAIEDLIEQQWNPELAFKQIQVTFQKAEVNKAIEHYLQLKKTLTNTEKEIDKYIKRVKSTRMENKMIPICKAIQLKAKVIYQLAIIQDKLDLQDNTSYQQLMNKFRLNWIELEKIVGKKSKQNIYHYQNIYDAAVKNDTKLSAEQVAFKNGLQKQNLKNSLVDIRVSANKREQIKEEISNNYQQIAEMEWDNRSIDAQIMSIKILEGQYVVETLVFGQSHPKTLETGVKISEKHRKMKSFEKAVDILQFQKDKIPFSTMTQHTVLGKSEYMLGMAYLQMGEFGQAHWYFIQALDKYKSLKKTDFERYGPRFKVQLQLGRTYIFLSSFKKSEQKLNLYEAFIMKEKKMHSDIAEAKSQKGILYMRWGNYQKSKQQIVQSTHMYALTKGINSPQYAKCKCHSALVLSKLGKLGDKQKIIKDIEEANAIFNKFYTQNNQEQIHCMSYMMKYFNGEIFKKFQDYDFAHELYNGSIELQEQFQALKSSKIQKIQKNRDNYQQIACISHRIVDPKVQLAKKKTHELTCKAKMIECQIKMKSTIDVIEQNLDRLTEALQKEIVKNDNSSLIRDRTISGDQSSTNKQLLKTLKKFKVDTLSKVKVKENRQNNQRINTRNDTSITDLESASLLAHSYTRL